MIPEPMTRATPSAAGVDAAGLLRFLDAIETHPEVRPRGLVVQRDGYVIAEGTVDEHVAQLLIEKLPAVERIARDSELAEAGGVLAGYDGMNPDEFAESVLSQLDFD